MNHDDMMNGRMPTGQGAETDCEGAEWTMPEDLDAMATMERPTGSTRTAGVMLAGRYKVVRRLGEGGMGSVWLAEDTKLDGRKVAIKMLPALLAGKKGAYRQVKQEALMAMKLSHPNIATVRAFEEDEGGAPFLVMDYIEGEGLDDILSEKGKLSEEETRRLLGPVAAALDYAHGQGVVHRDVKPGNVMVRKDGVPFVLDFGIAREIQETMTRVTGRFSSGTLLYMSPEQLNGDQPRPSQDVYSFAVMAYQCLSGELPFSRGAIEDQIKHKIPAPLTEDAGSEALRSGVMAGLAKEPQGRPGTCAEVMGGAAATATSHDWSSLETTPSAGQGKTPLAVLKKNRKVLAWGGAAAAVALLLALVWPSSRVDPDLVRRVLVKKATAESLTKQIARLDPGQGFGDRLRDAEKKLKQGEEARLGRKYPKAEECFDASIEAAEWCQTNEALRKTAGEARDAAATAKNAIGKEGWGLSPWQTGETFREEAERAFGEGRFRDAEEMWQKAEEKYAETQTEVQEAKVERMANDQLDAARNAEGDRRWEEAAAAAGKVLKAAERMQVHEPGNEAAKQLKAEAERLLEPAFWVKPMLKGQEVTEGVTGTKLGEKVQAKAGERRTFMLEFAADGTKYRGSNVATAKPRGVTEVVVELEAVAPDVVALGRGTQAGETKTLTLPGGATMDMVWCPVDSFQMGSVHGGETNEMPAHTVELTKGFWMAKTEVTQRQWNSVQSETWELPENPSHFKGDDLPVENVSWEDCMAFCRTAGLSLPTEAEWEYACRAGSKEEFAGSIDQMAWYGEGDGGGTHPVGEKKANGWNLHDMHGNVWEWCADWYGDYPSGPVTDPTGPDNGKFRISRGGCYMFSSQACRSANRDWIQPDQRDKSHGFRPVARPE